MSKRQSVDIAAMRKAGKVVAEMHEVTRAAIRPGVTTGHLDTLAREVLEKRGATSNFLGYHGFPAVICASPNSMVVHGIPNNTDVLSDGDIISIDCGAIVDGWHGDAAYTAGVGAIPSEAKRLIQTTERCLWAAIDTVKDGSRIGDIGWAVQNIAEAAGFSVVREYVGHGIGRAMHELPQVPNFGTRGSGQVLRTGQAIAIEPMINVGAPETQVLEDGWSVVTQDGKWSAHFEHTVVVTDDGPEVTTV